MIATLPFWGIGCLECRKVKQKPTHYSHNHNYNNHNFIITLNYVKFFTHLESNKKNRISKRRVWDRKQEVVDLLWLHSSTRACGGSLLCACSRHASCNCLRVIVTIRGLPLSRMCWMKLTSVIVITWDKPVMYSFLYYIKAFIEQHFKNRVTTKCCINAHSTMWSLRYLSYGY